MSTFERTKKDIKFAWAIEKKNKLSIIYKMIIIYLLLFPVIFAVSLIFGLLLFINPLELFEETISGKI